MVSHSVLFLTTQWFHIMFFFSPHSSFTQCSFSHHTVRRFTLVSHSVLFLTTQCSFSHHTVVSHSVLFSPQCSFSHHTVVSECVRIFTTVVSHYVLFLNGMVSHRVLILTTQWVHTEFFSLPNGFKLTILTGHTRVFSSVYRINLTEFCKVIIIPQVTNPPRL